MKKVIEQNHASIIIYITIVCILFLCFTSPISQNIDYHNFADKNSYLGIPNFLNVISNIPFIIVGIIGCLKMLNLNAEEFPKTALLYFFCGVLLTGFGSAYYHWNPTNQTLLWDRLPMTIAFMSLLSAIISLHMENWSGKMLLYPLLILGISSCLFWYMTERNGHGDLRPYIFVQFYPLLIIPIIIFLFPIKKISIKLLFPMVGFYVLAKYFEHTDYSFYIMNNWVSGHTLKHIFAASATLAVLNIEKTYEAIRQRY